MTKYYIFLLIAMALIAIVQVILKTISVENSGSIINSLYNPLFYFASILLVMCFAMWFYAAAKIEFSVLIPANVLTIVISGFIGYFLFSEEISLRKIIAYVLITIGVITLMYSKSPDNSQNMLDKNVTIDV